MLGLRYLNILCVLLLSLVSNALSVAGTRTLVVFDDRIDELSSYSNLLNLLKEHSYDVTTLELSDKSTRINLYEKEDRLYDNLILFPVKGKHYSKQLAAKRLLRFHEDGGNILSITVPRVSSEPIHQYLNQLGIYPSPRTQSVKDLFQSNKNGVLEFSSKQLLNKYVYTTDNEVSFNFGDSVSASLLDNREQIVPILKAPKTSFTSGNKSRENLWTEGSQGYLATGFQNLLNARTSWIGSAQFFNNANFKQNEEFINQLINWTFKEKSVIKSTSVKHSHIDGTTYDETPYKVTDNITYSIALSEWTGEKWVPFISDDVQFELRQIDPYYRITMKAQGVAPEDETSEVYSTGSFKLPDRHGMFTLLTNYKRAGLTFVSESDVKAIRHLANDEYDRSYEIANAWVYLAAIFSVIVTFIAFVFFFITTPASVSQGFSTEKKQN